MRAVYRRAKDVPREGIDSVGNDLVGVAMETIR